jgi:hypothetical protein
MQQHRKPALRAFAGVVGRFTIEDSPVQPDKAPEPPAKRRGRPATLAIPAGANRDQFYRERYKAKQEDKPVAPKTPEQILQEQTEAKEKIERFVNSSQFGLSRPLPSGLPAPFTREELLEFHKDALEQFALDPEKTKEIVTFNAEQGLYLTKAPRGKGLLVTGFGKNKKDRTYKSSLELVAGHSQQSGILQSANLVSTIPAPDEIIFGSAQDQAIPEEYFDLEWIQIKVSAALSDPNIDQALRHKLENSSIQELHEFLTTPVVHFGNTGGSVGGKVNTSAPGTQDGESDPADDSAGKPKASGSGYNHYQKIIEGERIKLFERITPLENNLYVCSICRDMKGGRAKHTQNSEVEVAFEHFLSHKKTVAREIRPFLPKHMKEFRSIDSRVNKMTFNQLYYTEALCKMARFMPVKLVETREEKLVRLNKIIQGDFEATAKTRHECIQAAKKELTRLK